MSIPKHSPTPHREIALQRLAHAMRAVRRLPDSAFIVNVSANGYSYGCISIQVRPGTFRQVVHPPHRVRVDPDFNGETHFHAKIDGIEWSAVQRGVSS